MKLVLVFSCFLAFTAASPVENWQQIKSPMEHPRYREVLSKIYSQQNMNSDVFRGGRIVGGQTAAAGQFPFQIYGYFDDSWLCGGSIISSNFILTAAHCTYQVNFVDLFVGTILRDVNVPWITKVYAKDLIIHPLYNDNTILNDISLIRTPAIPINNVNIGVVALPTRAEAALNLSGSQFTISGFGLYSDSSSNISPNLKFVVVPVITNQMCARTFGPQYVRDTNICTDGTGGRGSCSGDSGGPGTVRLNNRNVQVGVVSYGASAGCELGYPDVFTRVGSYLDWISQNTGIVIN